VAVGVDLQLCHYPECRDEGFGGMFGRYGVGDLLKLEAGCVVGRSQVGEGRIGRIERGGWCVTILMMYTIA